MEVKNSVGPNAEQIAGFMEPGPSGPIYMVNLLKFKQRAEYADGRETDLTGARGLPGLHRRGDEAPRRVRRRGDVRCSRRAVGAR